MPRQPKYVAISEELIAQVRSGALRPGDKLPTERELAQRFNVHRMTVRQATDILARRGIVEKRLPLGVFVRQIESARAAHGMLNLVCPAEPSPLASLFIDYGIRRALQRHLQPRVVRIAPGDEHIAAEAVAAGHPSLVFGIGADRPGEISHAMRRANGRAVALAQRGEQLGIPSVVGDDYAGIDAAVQYLASIGHRRIGVICSFPGRASPIVENQVQYWRQAMLHHLGGENAYANEPDAGIIRIDSVAIGGNFAGAFKAVKRYLSQRPGQFTALVGLEEVVTEGAASACHHLGLRIPQDISLLAYARTFHSALAFPARTGIAVSVKGHVDAGLEMIDRANGGGLPAGERLRLIAPRLVIRQSTAPHCASA